MKFFVNAAAATALLVVSASGFAQAPPGGGGTGAPTCPARFTAAKLPINTDSLADRLLAEFVPGASQAVAILDSGTTIGGDPPATFTVPASTWEVSIWIYSPPGNTGWTYHDYSVYSGSGETGYWNSLDTAGTTTGGTVLSNNTTTTNGYNKCSAQIMLDLEFSNWFNAPQQINYEYRGTLQWKYAKYTSQNGQMVGSVYTQPVTWYAGQFARTVVH